MKKTTKDKTSKMARQMLAVQLEITPKSVKPIKFWIGRYEIGVNYDNRGWWCMAHKWTDGKGFGHPIMIKI